MKKQLTVGLIVFENTFLYLIAGFLLRLLGASFSQFILIFFIAVITAVLEVIFFSSKLYMGEATPEERWIYYSRLNAIALLFMIVGYLLAGEYIG